LGISSGKSVEFFIFLPGGPIVITGTTDTTTTQTPQIGHHLFFTGRYDYGSNGKAFHYPLP
jgi:hypothetical protein